MKIINRTVIVSRAEVQAFRRRWPCSGLPDRKIAFEFDTDWNLVDISTDYDGPDILALSQDASDFGRRAA